VRLIKNDEATSTEVSNDSWSQKF